MQARFLLFLCPLAFAVAVSVGCGGSDLIVPEAGSPPPPSMGEGMTDEEREEAAARIRDEMSR